MLCEDLKLTVEMRKYEKILKKGKTTIKSKEV